MLADSLGIKFYDKELTMLEAKKRGLDKKYVKELIYDMNLSQLMIKLNDEYPEYRLVQIIQSNYNTPIAVYYAVIEKDDKVITSKYNESWLVSTW